MYNLVLPYHCNIMLKYLPSQLVEAYMNSYPRACLTLSPDSIILSILLSRFSNGGFFDHILCGCEPQNSAMRCGCDPQKVRGSQPQAYCFRTTFSPLFSFFPKFLINTACRPPHLRLSVELWPSLHLPGARKSERPQARRRINVLANAVSRTQG